MTVLTLYDEDVLDAFNRRAVFEIDVQIVLEEVMNYKEPCCPLRNPFGLFSRDK